jgi:hypothetical protein
MPVKTTADQHLEIARDAVEEAIRELTEIVVHECSGHNDFTPEYRTALENTFQQLLQIRKALRG